MSRNILNVSRIHNDEEIWMEDQNDIADVAINFFQRQFSKYQNYEDFLILDELPVMVILE